MSMYIKVKFSLTEIINFETWA